MSSQTSDNSCGTFENWGGEGRSEGSLIMKQPGREGPPWAAGSRWVFLRKQLPGTQCPRTQDCLPALLIIHSLWLSSRLPVGSCLVWDGRFLSSKPSNQSVHVSKDMQHWCVAKVEAWAPRMGTCPHSCHLQLLGHPYWVSAAVLFPPLAPGNELMAVRSNWGDECGSSAAPPLTWTHSLKALQAIKRDQMQPFLDLQATWSLAQHCRCLGSNGRYASPRANLRPKENPWGSLLPDS